MSFQQPPEKYPMQQNPQSYIPSQGMQNYPPQQGPQRDYAPQPQMQPIPGDEKHIRMPPTQSFKNPSFQSGLFDCCTPCSTGCLGCWCPCILFGKTRARLQRPELKNSELPCCSGSCCGFATVTMLCPGWQFIFGWMQRSDVRARYDIEGDECTDCLSHWCCDCCALIQEYKEVQAREDAAQLGMGGQHYH